MEVPLVFVKDVVVFPGTYASLVLSDQTCINSPSRPSIVAIIGLKSTGEFQDIGTLSSIMTSISLKDRVVVSSGYKTGHQQVTSKIQVVVEGLEKVHILHLMEKKEGLQYAEVEIVHDQESPDDTLSFRETAIKHLSHHDIDQKLKEVTLEKLRKAESLAAQCNIVANTLKISYKAKQQLFMTKDANLKAAQILKYLKCFELSEDTDDDAVNSNSWAKYRKASADLASVDRTEGYLGSLDELDLDNEVDEVIRTEVGNLAHLEPNSPEYFRAVTYVETVLKLPWKAVNAENTNILKAQQILDADIVGMSRVKQRLLEHIAVYSLTSHSKGAVICLNGPPGVGKTSIAESVAKAMGRPFGKISLGGVTDEETIRGSRRTYLGAMPGNLISQLVKLKCKNPVILLDEVDKVNIDSSYNNVSAALLEVLDKSMNSAFVDHYLGIPFDLSKVVFIATCNSTDSIPSALLDRMEVIDVDGYSTDEKLMIAETSLIPRALDEAGLAADSLSMSSSAVTAIIEDYTSEAGVRELRRKLDQVCRYIAYEAVTSAISFPYAVHVNNLEEILGVSDNDMRPLLICKL